MRILHMLINEKKKRRQKKKKIGPTSEKKGFNGPPHQKRIIKGKRKSRKTRNALGYKKKIILKETYVKNKKKDDENVNSKTRKEKIVKERGRRTGRTTETREYERTLKELSQRDENTKGGEKEEEREEVEDEWQEEGGENRRQRGKRK